MLTIAEPEQVADLYEESANVGEPRALFKCLDLRGRTFTGLRLHCSDWIECDLDGSIFTDCDLRGASFADSNLRNVIFRRCSMYACDLPEDASIRRIDCTDVL